MGKLSEAMWQRQRAGRARVQCSARRTTVRRRAAVDEEVALSAILVRLHLQRIYNESASDRHFTFSVWRDLGRARAAHQTVEETGLNAIPTGTHRHC
jgi:hypothetical protein